MRPFARRIGRVGRHRASRSPKLSARRKALGTVTRDRWTLGSRALSRTLNLADALDRLALSPLTRVGAPRTLRSARRPAPVAENRWHGGVMSVERRQGGCVLERGVSPARACVRWPTASQAMRAAEEERGREALATVERRWTGRRAPERPLAGRRDPPREGRIPLVDARGLNAELCGVYEIGSSLVTP